MTNSSIYIVISNGTSNYNVTDGSKFLHLGEFRPKRGADRHIRTLVPGEK